MEWHMQTREQREFRRMDGVVRQMENENRTISKALKKWKKNPLLTSDVS